MSQTQIPTREQAQEMNIVELVALLHDHGHSKYHPGYKAATLVNALESHDLLAPSSPIDITESELKEGEKLIYYVRYVGLRRADVTHNINSTPSRRKYQFPRGLWVSVEQIDYEKKYERFVTNAIRSQKVPDWEVRKYSSLRGFIDKYSKPIRKIAEGRVAKNLRDLKHVDERVIRRLRDNNIHSIGDFVRFPTDWLSKVINLDHGKIIDMMDEARKSIKRHGVDKLDGGK